MIFYEDFVKKIKNGIEQEYKEKEVYRLDASKKAVLLGTAIPMILVGIYFAYVGYINNFAILNFIFAAIFFYIAIKSIKTIVAYKLVVDNVNNKLIHNNVEILFDKIESCTLKEGRLGEKGKEYVVLLDMITYEKKQYLIPLLMNKKEKFVKNIKVRAGNNFKII